MYVGFSLAQPYLIGSMITFITFHDRLPGNYGYGLVGAYALCYLGLAVRLSFLASFPLRPPLPV